MKRIKKRGQQWSMETILAVSVFLVVFVFVILFISYRSPTTTKPLEIQSVILYDKARSADGGFIDEGIVQRESLNDWYDVSRNQSELDNLKRELGLSGSFCIYFENGNGQTLVRQDDSGDYYFGVGDGTILLGDTPCGSNATIT